MSKIKHNKSIYYSNKFNSAVDTKRTWKIIRDIVISKTNNRESDVDVNMLNELLANIPLPTVNPGFYAQMPPNKPSVAKFKCFVEGFTKSNKMQSVWMI